MAGVGTRRQIQVVQLSTTVETGGFRKPSQRIVYSGWADVRNASGYREYNQGQPQIANLKEFRIRHNLTEAANTETRVIYAGKQYTATSILRDEEKNFYTIIIASALDAGRL